MSDKPKIKWLLVDVGGVLLLKDTEHTFIELLAHELGVDVGLAQAINKVHYTTMETKYVSEEEFVTDLNEKLGYKAPKNIFSYFDKAYKKQIHPNVELFHFLEEMRAKGIKTAVLSNTIAIYSESHKEAGISKANGFDPILYSWRVGMTKPNRDIFELALKELDAKSEEIVFIDDKQEHIDGAQQVGIRTVLFHTTNSVMAAIQELESDIIKSKK